MPADDIEVIHMTAMEWDRALTNSLSVLGLTWGQLTEEAKAGDFSSWTARQLWLMAGGRGPYQSAEGLSARLAEAERRAEHAEGELSALRDHCARWEAEKARADKAEQELAEVTKTADERQAHIADLRKRLDWNIGQADKQFRGRREAEAKLQEIAMVKVWTNEDGKRFVFADDLANILLGSQAETTTTPAQEAT